MKRGLIFIFAVGALIVVGKYFILPNIPAVAPPDNLTTGNYDILYGTWQSDKTDAKGGLKIMLQISGEKLSGELKVTNSPITKGGEISGTIQGNELKFGFVRDKFGILKYTGTVGKDSMQGEWEIPLIKDRGTWQAEKKS